MPKTYTGINIEAVGKGKTGGFVVYTNYEEQKDGRDYPNHGRDEAMFSDRESMLEHVEKESKRIEK